MNKKSNYFYFLFVLIINFSCVEKKSIEKENNSKIDTLKFKSPIRTIFEDSKGRYWFGSNQEGVAMYDGRDFVYFTVADGLGDNQIHRIQEDQKGIIWLNTQQGLSSYDGSQIKSHTATQNSTNFLQNQPPPADWSKSDSDFWFGAGTKEGVYKFDGQNLKYLPFPPHKILSPSDNLFAVTDIAKGKNNMIWFATYAGVFGYNGKEFTIINDETLGFDRNIAPLHIRSIFEDTKGRLWIGNNGIGVLLKDGDSIINFSEKNNLIHPTSGRKGDKSMPGTLEHVFVIAEDKNGNIWFGDRDAGIWKYDGSAMTNYTKKGDITNDYALSIFEDKKGLLWFGMADGSVLTFNGQTFVKQF